jgi:hypothetical protein
VPDPITIFEKDSTLLKSLGTNEVIDHKTQNFAGILSNIDVVTDTLDGNI